MSNLSEYWNIRQLRVPENKLQSAYAEQKENFFPRNSSVCDIGGGQGADAEYFIRHGHNVTLVDLSDIALQRAEKRAQKIKQGDKLKIIRMIMGEGHLPIDNQTIDVVFSRLVFHSFNRQQIKEVLQDMKRILKPNGTAYITVKSPDDLEGMDFLRKTATEILPDIYNDGGRIQNRFSVEQWKEIVTESGITHFDIRPYIDDISNRGDALAESGRSTLLLTEIEFTV